MISRPGQPYDPLTLGYEARALGLPTFSLPPPVLNQLRILHGSCRKPHADGFDALVATDVMIEFDHSRPDDRPHQLFLTGDQIYADDVARPLLREIVEAAPVLFGFQETLPGNPPADQLRPGARATLVNRVARMTTEEGDSHLLTFGEFACMYLYAWSDVLWPDPLPDSDRPAELDYTSRYYGQRVHLQNFRNALARVRRALANVPTYMILDDHEVTDDWYINRRWCRDVLGSPLGRRVIINGLHAYALFQGWGNKPEDFREPASGSRASPGYSLLALSESLYGALSSRDTAAAETTREGLARILAVPRASAFSNRLPRDPRPDDELHWHYVVRGPAHEVFVLDLRTWRTYPGGLLDPPTAISPAGIDVQLATPAPADAPVPLVTLVVASVPWMNVPRIEAIQAQYSTATADPFARDFEAPGAERNGFELLLAGLAARIRVNPVAGGPGEGIVVMLSGDVHYGYSMRICYETLRPLGHRGAGHSRMTLAQLTSSACKNESGESRRYLHNNVSWPSVGSPDHFARLAWLNDESTSRSGLALSIVNTSPGLAPVPTATVFPEAGEFTRYEHAGTDRLYVIRGSSPHWWYRVDLRPADPPPTQVARPNPAPRPVGSPAGLPRADALTPWRDMATNHALWATRAHPGYAVVGVNNLGEIRFLDWPHPDRGMEPKLVHRLWWRFPEASAEFRPYTRWTIPMDFDHPDYPPIYVP
ncbi:MAG TPA: hypothetical protein VJ866_23380 [Pyrinomonadaceae bacterium]|nr:hypothetical protein [Pyrinomonadaceae bacterium]